MNSANHLPQDTSRSSAERRRPPKIAGIPGHPERVIWLGCAGHRIPALLGHLESSLDPQDGIGSLVVVLDRLEQLEDSVTGLLGSLFSLAEEWKMETTVVDPSGLAPALAEILSGGRPQALWDAPALQRGPARLLFVEPPDGGLEILRSILRLFHVQSEVVHTAGEARRALVRSPRDVIVLDLDLPCAQSLGVAEFVRDHDLGTALVGLTAMEDVWNLEVSVRYGFQTILGRPVRLRDLLTAIGKAVAA